MQSLYWYCPPNSLIERMGVQCHYHQCHATSLDECLTKTLQISLHILWNISNYKNNVAIKFCTSTDSTAVGGGAKDYGHHRLILVWSSQSTTTTTTTTMVIKKFTSQEHAILCETGPWKLIVCLNTKYASTMRQVLCLNAFSNVNRFPLLPCLNSADNVCSQACQR